MYRFQTVQHTLPDCHLHSHYKLVAQIQLEGLWTYVIVHSIIHGSIHMYKMSTGVWILHDPLHYFMQNVY